MKKLFLLLGLVSVLFISCSDDSESNETYTYKVRMTDAPAPYDAVYIDVQGVEVKSSNGETFTLDTQAQVYDLLELSNGFSIEIASDVITEANVSQVRLILGPNNSVVIDGQTYPLSTPSAQQSGLKLNVNQTLSANIENTLLIDFDAHQSIVIEGNGTYSLKPVLRVINVQINGSVSGSISLVGIPATVTAVSSSGVEYTTIVNDQGEFVISGLNPGTYTFVITPEDPYLPITIENVEVMAGSNTDLGVVVIP
ncbi:DUF4382 domain-containing protein [Flavobacterium okayamense]|uniref:DUF4382 domain-containing protein n=1 Tax=Flavobacterium okayamense TaxID=2830782 RepID=A0ABN6HY61_9FLAO|nr:DUF4382 domain-containing protein [Flavobacterium okayamense]BCY29295.1 hypothetical protein KK2020170_21630 [Flavobacterium okayamense]